MDEITEPQTPYALVQASLQEQLTPRGWDIPRAIIKLEKFARHFNVSSKETDSKLLIEELCDQAKEFLAFALQMQRKETQDGDAVNADDLARKALPYRQAFVMIFGCMPRSKKDPSSV